MSMGEATMLRRMVAVIVDEVDPERIILFGSRARGEAGPDSDVDLLVVEPAGGDAEMRDRRAMAGRLYRRLAGFGIPKDVVIYSAAEVGRHGKSPNHVVGRALREGRCLYERPAG